MSPVLNEHDLYAIKLDAESNCKGASVGDTLRLLEQLARVEAERDAMEAMVSMLEEKEWAEHASKGPVSSRLETCITTLHNELHEANERADEAQVSGMAYAEQRDAAQAQLAEAVGLLRKLGSLPYAWQNDQIAIDAFLADYAQAEQQEFQPLPRDLQEDILMLTRKAEANRQREAQGAQPAVLVSDWKEWDGERCPLAPHKPVKVRYRNGEEDSGQAITFDWYHNGKPHPHDIVAYQLAAPADAHGDEVLLKLFNQYKSLADSGDAGFWSLEKDTEAGKVAAQYLKSKGLIE